MHSVMCMRLLFEALRCGVEHSRVRERLLPWPILISLSTATEGTVCPQNQDGHGQQFQSAHLLASQSFHSERQVHELAPRCVVVPAGAEGHPVLTDQPDAHVLRGHPVAFGGGLEHIRAEQVL